MKNSKSEKILTGVKDLGTLLYALPEGFEDTEKTSVNDLLSNDSKKNVLVFEKIAKVMMSNNKFKKKGKKSKDEKREVYMVKFYTPKNPDIKMRTLIGSEVIKEQLEKFQEHLPFSCTIWKIKKYYCLRGAK